MTDRRTEQQLPASSKPMIEQRRPPVPDVWFSSPPEDEPLDEKPRSATGVQILFTSPAQQART
ncbi:hypothetical protein AB0F81_41865 [Actinoplanes sp. NPDC024001]|uniref:hypothetical protein n=1 Tax=Actinoplanes sp. NPDC024001 TaxID=3154598 RepID=UPI0033C5C02D